MAGVWRGALVEVVPGVGMSKPNVVAFQFTPETLRHSWTQAEASTAGADPRATKGMPGESFSFTLAMDVTDDLALGPLNPLGAVAMASGIYSRLAALELLMFPAKPPAPLAGQSPPKKGEKRGVPAGLLPTVLFVWNPLRIVPVRVTSLAITETLFDEARNPTHAEAQIELRVLTSTELERVTGPLRDVAVDAYQFSRVKRELLAALNLANAAGSLDLVSWLRG